MRPCISITEIVRPSVRPSVGPRVTLSLETGKLIIVITNNKSFHHTVIPSNMRTHRWPYGPCSLLQSSFGLKLIHQFSAQITGGGRGRGGGFF